MSLRFTDSVTKFSISGEGRKKSLQKIGIETVEDLLFFFPRRYHDLRNIKKISELVPGEIVSVYGRVLAREEQKTRHNLSYLKVAIGDDTGVLYIVFFNQLYLNKIFLPEHRFFLNGKVEIFGNNLQITNPIYESKITGRRDLLLPVYPLTSGITQNFLRKQIKLVLSNCREYPLEMMPFNRRQKMGLPNMRYALSNIHFPRSDIDLEKARDYLIFNEFLNLQLNLLYRKMKAQHSGKQTDILHIPSKNSIKEFERFLPFSLTGGQKKVMKEILADLEQGKIIQRLVQGEVGSGKTVIAIFCLYLLALQGWQGVFLVPTEILAEQHFLNWQEFFLERDIPVSLLVGQTPKKEKEKIYEKTASGEIKIVIGTHSLLAEKISFRKMKVVVIDEQHKFGVEQRELIKQKGDNPHYIVMSATPIPRSIALTFYGCLDFSTVGEMPIGERNVMTSLFSKKEKEKVFEFLRFQSEQKKQGFLVTPAIEGREDIESAVTEYELIKTRLPDMPAALIHGRMPFAQKQDVMKKFREKEILLLVATSVIESGIDVPEASFIIIEQAERFGLSQLHQLRGRIGRKGELGYCFLISYSCEEHILNRLETFVSTEKGIDIAEIDLKLRGQGDLLGTRQHGIPVLRIGNIVSDMRILDAARTEAGQILTDDPELEKEQHKQLKKILRDVTVYQR